MNYPFDERAETWDADPQRRRLAADILTALNRHVTLCPDWTALDYGAGTGLIALALALRVRHVLAVDSSAGMLNVLARKVRLDGVANVDVFCADFMADPLPPGPCNLVTSAMTLHHIAAVDLLFLKFFDFLVPGGYLALADLDAEDGSFHGYIAGIPHLGFDRASIVQQLAAAGFCEIRCDTAAGIVKNGLAYTVFLASARKPVF